MAVENGKVDKSKCVSTNCGKMKTDLDMRTFHVLNLPLPQTDNEPITKALYNRLQSDFGCIKDFCRIKACLVFQIFPVSRLRPERLLRIIVDLIAGPMS